MTCLQSSVRPGVAPRRAGGLLPQASEASERGAFVGVLGGALPSVSPAAVGSPVPPGGALTFTRETRLDTSPAVANQSADPSLRPPR